MNYTERFIGGWISVASGLVTIITLGRIIPDWEFRWVAYCALKDIERRKKIDR